MNETKVHLVILPDTVDPGNLRNCDPAMIGTTFSTAEELNANIVRDGYSVLYRSHDICVSDMKTLIYRLVDLFRQNVPSSAYEFSINYRYQPSESGGNQLLAEEMIEIKIYEIESLFKAGIDGWTYVRTASVAGLHHDLVRQRNAAAMRRAASGLDPAGYDPFKDGIPGVDFPDIYEGRDLLRDASNSPFAYAEDDDYDEDDDDEDDEDDYDDYDGDGEDEGAYDVHYSHSRVMSNAENPKKAYRRHGLLIADSKEDLEDDYQIIRKFLKHFLPGKEKWKKEFRKELAVRWMDMYAVSKKRMKKLEKHHRRSMNQKRRRSPSAHDMAVDFTRRVLEMNQDARWNDPSK